MEESEALRNAIERLVEGNASDEERTTVQSRLLAGQILLTDAERGLTIGGDATVLS